MSVRSLNGLSSVFVNTIQAGDAISVSSSGTSISTVNVDISKQSANTTIANTDLFLLEDSSGNIRKITGANMKSELEQSEVVSPLLLTGNSISIKGLSGFTANKFLKVNSAGDAIEYADSTNFWTYSSPSLRPNNTTDNLLLGTTSNTNSRKLIVVGNTELQDLYLQSDKKIISTNNSSDYLQFGNGTLTNNYSSNVINNTLSMGASADINLATGRAITRGTDAGDRITFNANNFTFGNTGIFNNSVQVKSTTSSNSGHVSFFEANDNGQNNIDLHCPETTTHDYNAYLPKISDTNITSVYILSNRNILAGTNVSISGTETITINSSDTNTTYTGGTNISLAGTTFNLDTTLTGAMTFSDNITFSSVPSINATVRINGGSGLPAIINFYDIDGSHALSIRSQDNLTADRDLTLPAVDADDFLISRTSTDILTNKTFGNATTFNGIPVVNETLRINGGSGLPAIIDMYDIDGSHALSIRSQDNLTNNRDLTLPAVGANDFLLSRTSTDDLLNKSFTDLTTFNLGLAVKNSIATVSGSVQFYNKDNTNYIDLRIEEEDVDANITVFLPATLDNTVLVGRQTTDILANKTFSSNTLFNLAIQFYNIQASAITSTLQSSQTGLVLTGSTIDLDTNMKFRNTADSDDYLQIGDDITFNFNNMKVKQDSKLINATNTECFLKFENTLLTNTFHRNEFVKLTIKKNTSYTAGTENGYIELIENGTTSNTTRLYFNNAGTAFIFYNGTNLIHTPNFTPSDNRVKKNETLANTSELSNAFDKIDIYKYQYEEQYAIDKGADPNKYVYGFIAQNVKEQTDNLSNQFSSVGEGESIYPNDKVDYSGDKLVVNDLITVNKTDINLLLWGKIKEMDAIIKNQQVVINNLLNATTFSNFKKM